MFVYRDAMTSALVLPPTAAPSNMRFRDTVTVRRVTSDMFDICKRIRELDPNLVVDELEEDGRTAYVIAELCADGVERLVFRVDALDARVVTKLQYLMAMPLDKRVLELEKVEHKANLDAEDEAFERLYENMGGPMWTELERCGFITSRPVSYPKTGVTGGKGSKGKT